jgi:hypothetical protein
VCIQRLTSSNIGGRAGSDLAANITFLNLVGRVLNEDGSAALFGVLGELPLDLLAIVLSEAQSSCTFGKIAIQRIVQEEFGGGFGVCPFSIDSFRRDITRTGSDGQLLFDDMQIQIDGGLQESEKNKIYCHEICQSQTLTVTLQSFLTYLIGNERSWLVGPDHFV